MIGLDENISDFIFNVAMIMLFIAGLSIFFMLYPLSNKNNDLIRQNIGNGKEVMQVAASDAVPFKISGAELIGKIYSGLDYDIIVDGKEYSKSNFQDEITDLDAVATNEYLDEKNLYSLGEDIDNINIDPSEEYTIIIDDDINRNENGIKRNEDGVIEFVEYRKIIGE